MEKNLKTVVKIAVIIALLLFSHYFIPILVGGYLAVKTVGLGASVVRGVRDRRDMKDGKDLAMVRLNRKLHARKVSKKFFDVSNNCWIINRDTFPLDMVPDRVNGRMTRFTCSGVRDPEKGCGIVSAEYKGTDLFGRQKVEFSLTMDSAEKAVLIDQFIRKNGILGCRVESSIDGLTPSEEGGMGSLGGRSGERVVYHVRSDNPEDINELVKQFYPASTMTVEREVITTRQYLVKDCASFKEAVEKVNDIVSKNSEKPYNTAVRYVDTVEGVKGHPMFVGDSFLYDRSKIEKMPAGMYLVNAETRDVYNRQVVFHALDLSTNDAMRSQASDSFIHDEGDKVEDRCVIEPVLSDGLNGERMTYFLENRGEKFDLCTAADLEGRNLYVDYGFNDIMQVCRLMGDSTEEVFTNRLAYVSRGEDVRGDEKSLFHISIPVDSELLGAMTVSSKAPDEIYDEYRCVGLDREDAKTSYMNHLIERDGSFTTSLMGEPELDLARINGVPFKEFEERLSRSMDNGNLISLSTQEEMLRWLNDAVRISSVEETVDMKERTFKIRYVYIKDNVQYENVETKNLSDEQMNSYLARPKFSDVELKDLIMQLHPEIFATYAGEDGKGLYRDPVDSAISMAGPDGHDAGMRVENGCEVVEEERVEAGHGLRVSRM